MSIAFEGWNTLQCPFPSISIVFGLIVTAAWVGFLVLTTVSSEAVRGAERYCGRSSVEHTSCAQPPYR